MFSILRLLEVDKLDAMARHQHSLVKTFFIFFLNCMFYQLLRVQQSLSSTQSWSSVLPSIVEIFTSSTQDAFAGNGVSKF